MQTGLTTVHRFLRDSVGSLLIVGYLCATAGKLRARHHNIRAELRTGSPVPELSNAVTDGTRITTGASASILAERAAFRFVAAGSGVRR